MACAHVRVTCGGWDGVSCDGRTGGSAEGRAALAEYLRIDAEARTICPETDETRQVYQGAIRDVIRAVDDALGRADALDHRLSQLRNEHATPGWKVATLARAGSVYDCIWTSLRQASPTLFTPKQQALLQKLQQLSLQLSPATSLPPSAQPLTPAVADTITAVREKWQSTRSQLLSLLADKLVPRYVGAAVIARRFALDELDFARTFQRLPVVAATLGDETMSRIVGAMADPTDPQSEGTEPRHLHYVAGAFDRLRGQDRPTLQTP
jgi:hypothetical protein